MNNRLPKRGILRRKKDFERVLFRGRRLKAGPVSLYYAPNPNGQRRSGFIATGRYPSNVARNSVKRRLREIFRTNQERFPGGLDFILRGEPAAAGMDFSVLRDTLLKLTEGVVVDRKS